MRAGRATVMAYNTSLGWDIKANTPLLSGGRMRLRGDAWLAGRGEREVLSGLIAHSFNSDRRIADRIAQPPLVLHRIPAPLGEYAVEIFGHGLRLGSMEINPATGEWVLHPSGALASILASLGHKPAVTGRHARGRLKGKRLPSPYCSQASYVLVDAGSHVGVARSLGETGECKVKDVAPKGFKPLPPADPRIVAGANKDYVEGIAREAVGFIRNNTPGRGTVHVAVSGGLDSTVAAALAVRALGSGRVRLVYADTGMDPPESRRTVERLADRLGVQLDIVEAGVDPVREMARRGLMSRENRWCTRLFKLEPLRRYYERRRARVVVEGVRGWESTLRRGLPRAGVNPAIPGVRRLLPILYWRRIDVQVYAHLDGLPVNPLYEQGFTRIGCMICPAMTLHELRLASSRWRSFYERLAIALEPPGVKGGLEYILSGKWRRKPGG